MPVLPEVGSTITESGPRMPRASASSIIARAMRSLMVPPGFWRSSLAQTLTRGSKSWLMRTCGVSPMVSRMLSKVMVVAPCSDDEVDGIGRLGHGPDADLALVVDERVGRHRVGQADVAADDAVGADDRVAAEDGRVGVDDDAVPDGGVALGARASWRPRARRA